MRKTMKTFIAASTTAAALAAAPVLFAAPQSDNAANSEQRDSGGDMGMMHGGNGSHIRQMMADCCDQMMQHMQQGQAKKDQAEKDQG